ncbi:hypothetical protein [Thalassospira lohafexi]|uniref:Uncharacterized protein n=1 Tax=Thalassospira lohafexi TaxID=744227 RepID=A0A2N3L461_9PROT|nr:hypothetical protein [Thalassospira lohafexi]PKR57516.1 hypothetical protein COO92_16375 [Thalassospira lohafexi]
MTVWGIFVQAIAILIGAAVLGGGSWLFGAPAWLWAIMAIVGAALGWVCLWVVIAVAMCKGG